MHRKVSQTHRSNIPPSTRHFILKCRVKSANTINNNNKKKRNFFFYVAHWKFTLITCRDIPEINKHNCVPRIKSEHFTLFIFPTPHRFHLALAGRMNGWLFFFFAQKWTTSNSDLGFQLDCHSPNFQIGNFVLCEIVWRQAGGAESGRWRRKKARREEISPYPFCCSYKTDSLLWHTEKNQSFAVEWIERYLSLFANRYHFSQPNRCRQKRIRWKFVQHTRNMNFNCDLRMKTIANNAFYMGKITNQTWNVLKMVMSSSALSCCAYIHLDRMKFVCVRVCLCSYLCVPKRLSRPEYRPPVKTASHFSHPCHYVNLCVIPEKTLKFYVCQVHVYFSSFENKYISRREYCVLVCVPCCAQTENIPKSWHARWKLDSFCKRKLFWFYRACAFCIYDLEWTKNERRWRKGE